MHYVSTASNILTAHVRSDMSALTHGTLCLVQLFGIVTVCVLSNLNLIVHSHLIHANFQFHLHCKCPRMS